MCSPANAHWRIDAAIAVGLGAFRGSAGHNRAHRHWAHQLTVGFGAAARIRADEQVRAAPGWFIASGIRHQLLAGPVVSCYLDPTTQEGRALNASLGAGAKPQPLPEPMLALVRRALIHTPDLAQGLEFLRRALRQAPPTAADPRLEAAIQTLVQAHRGGTPMTRAELAALTGLSPSRFSHWFSGRTGVPLRSYRKWLRLVRGLEYALNGKPLTTAAHAAGFADQAHFTRSFVNMFGVKPSAVLRRPA